MWRWLTNNHQTLTGIGAMLVGIAALFVAWDQGRVMRAQQHGAVVPAVQVDAFTQTGGDRVVMGLRVANNGVGPAFVESVSVTRDGVAADSLDGMFASMPAGVEDRSWNNMTGRVLAPGEMVVPLEVNWPASDVAPSALAALFVEWERWDAIVCYCSVFDRCWTASVQRADRQRVEQCPRPEADIFELYGAEPFLAGSDQQAE
ncbi:hypothetical protein [uncultured Maricaulis sp.]|uniref:hypothetical protein n=1 Tax=uncultured Maricaulis sp. TaxID=174710 RepID=UPI0030D70B31